MFSFYADQLCNQTLRVKRLLCFAKLTKVQREEIISSHTLLVSLLQREYGNVCSLPAMILCRPADIHSSKLLTKITDIQVILLSRDLTPCMLLLVKLLQQCRTFADTVVHCFVRACHSVTALSCCYRPCCFLKKSVLSGEVHGSQREVLTWECEKPGVKC